MPTDKVKEKLHALFVEYAKNLPNKVDGINQQWVDLKGDWDQKKFEDFHRQVHNLCGSAGTYGYAELGAVARQLEIYVKSLLPVQAVSDDQYQNIDHLLDKLNQSFQQSIPVTFSDIDETQTQRNSDNFIYILDKDSEFIREIGQPVKESGYHLRTITDIASLEKAINEKPPIAIIVDIRLIGESDIKTLYDIQHIFSIPLLCSAASGDIITRLKAIRLGGRTFFKKPVDPFYLIKMLDQHCGFAAVEPYRILIVDDSQVLAEYFSIILQDAGMVTRSITNPLLLIETIVEFQPDLLLMDVYMPECTGFELAAVLRQQDQYTTIPIIFLSTEDDRLKQLYALNLGGDDFLTKPILPRHLVEAVKSRAKRAGILSSFMTRDSLTGLLNHTNILQRLDAELSRAMRQAEPLSFVMLDIDHFKNINDTYGHLAGDEILKSISNLLLNSLRRSDIAGRYGGEEFAIILPNTTKENSLKLCNQLREKFAGMVHQFNGIEFHVTFSAGICSFPDLQEAKSIIDCADRALYHAKQDGRNKVVYQERKSDADLPFN